MKRQVFSLLLQYHCERRGRAPRVEDLTSWLVSSEGGGHDERAFAPQSEALTHPFSGPLKENIK